MFESKKFPRSLERTVCSRVKLSSSSTAPEGISETHDNTGRFHSTNILGMPTALVDIMEQAGFVAPTTIQKYAWPALLAQEDFIGRCREQGATTRPLHRWVLFNDVDVHDHGRGMGSV